MNYSKIYNDLVEKAKSRGLDKSKHEGYFEIHHILPKCLGGSDDKSNLVMFTGREHYLAHLILWKMYPKENGLFHAAWMMSNKRFIKHKSRLYEKLKIEHVKTLGARSGIDNPNFIDLTGVRSGKLTVISQDGWAGTSKGHKQSTWLCECDCGTMKVLKSKEVSPNSKGAYKSCGCLISESASLQVGEKNPFFGKVHSDESKAKMAAKKLGKSPSNKGVPMTELRRSRIIATLALIERHPWTHPTVVTRDSNLTMWAMADFYYDLYSTNPELTPARFVTLYNKLYDDNLTANALNTFHREFRKGWIPTEDPKWVKFSEDHLGVN